MPQQPATAREITRERPADFDMELAARLLREHRIEGHDLPHIDRLQSELGGDPTDLFPTKETEMLLQQMTEPQHSRPLLVRRIVRDNRVDMTLKLNW